MVNQPQLDFFVIFIYVSAIFSLMQKEIENWVFHLIFFIFNRLWNFQSSLYPGHVWNQILAFLNLVLDILFFWFLLFVLSLGFLLKLCYVTAFSCLSYLFFHLCLMLRFSNFPETLWLVFIISSAFLKIYWIFVWKVWHLGILAFFLNLFLFY